MREHQSLEGLRELADRDVWDVADRRIKRFLDRALPEGYPPFSFRESLAAPGCFYSPHARDLSEVDIAFIGVPMDQGAVIRTGARHGPETVRRASRTVGPVHERTGTIPFELCRIGDRGEVEFTGYALQRRVEDIRLFYQEVRDAGVTPFGLGGEHTMTAPILAALGASRPLALVQIDAHADSTGQFGGERINDGSLVRFAAADGFIDPTHTVQVGMRNGSFILWDFSHQSGMTYLTADDVYEAGVDDIVRVIHEVVGDMSVYLSLDLDAIDPAFMPAVGSPEPFGLTSRQVRDLIRGLRGLDLVGADMVELCPGFDSNGVGENLAAGLAFEILCLLAESHSSRVGETRPTVWA